MPKIKNAARVISCGAHRAVALGLTNAKPKPQLGGAEVHHRQDGDYGKVFVLLAHS